MALPAVSQASAFTLAENTFTLKRATQVSYFPFTN